MYEARIVGRKRWREREREKRYRHFEDETIFKRNFSLKRKTFLSRKMKSKV